MDFTIILRTFIKNRLKNKLKKSLTKMPAVLYYHHEVRAMSKRREKGEGTVFQRKSDGLWIAEYKHEGSAKKKYFSGKTESEAKKKLREYKKEIAKNGYVEIQKKTVQDYMSNWFNVIKAIELKPKSLDALTHTLNNQVYPRIGSVQLASLNARDIQAMINQLTLEKYAYSTIKKAYNAINSCFKLAVIKGDVGKNPCLGVKLPKNIANRNGEARRFLTQDECEKLCAESIATYPNGKQIYRLGHSVILMLYTGMRLAELLGLRWASIDFENKTVRIDRTAVYVINRDKKSDNEPKHKLIVQNSAKTDSSVRVVQLNQKAIAALKAIQEFNGGFEYVMSNSNGKIMSPRNFDRMLRNIMERCGIEPSGAHTLRHTFASMLFKSGVEAKTVSALLGHSNVAITYDTYIHLINEQKQQAVDILDTL